MVRAYHPQAFQNNIMYNTNYPPQSNKPGSGGEPTFDDEDYLLGAERDSSEYLIVADRNSVDFELVI